MKVLGFHLPTRPNVAAHVKAVRKRLRQRYWILFHLKNYCFSQDDLCKVYCNIICPVADYCCVVYHAMLTDEQDETLDRCQAHALRCIFGKEMSYADMRKKAGVTTLRQRRIDLIDKFASKCLKNPRFSSWFPLKDNGRTLRGPAAKEKYKETFAHCERLRNSPVHYMRRRLNGKGGKIYGLRYKDRRSSTT